MPSISPRGVVSRELPGQRTQVHVPGRGVTYYPTRGYLNLDIHPWKKILSSPSKITMSSRRTCQKILMQRIVFKSNSERRNKAVIDVVQDFAYDSLYSLVK